MASDQSRRGEEARLATLAASMLQSVHNITGRIIGDVVKLVRESREMAYTQVCFGSAHRPPLRGGAARRGGAHGVCRGEQHGARPPREVVARYGLVLLNIDPAQLDTHGWLAEEALTASVGSGWRTVRHAWTCGHASCSVIVVRWSISNGELSATSLEGDLWVILVFNLNSRSLSHR